MADRYRFWLPVLAFGVLAAAGNARADCDSSFGSTLQNTERFVATMRADKPGQARVFAVDGSEYTAGLVRWMTAELRAAGRDCRDARPAEAAKHLAAVQETLSSSQRR